MNVVTRGIRNAFRNGIRTVSIVVILGLSLALALAMLIARQAVSQKIDSVKGSVGNTITVSPAGVRGFEGGGNPLTEAQMDKVKTLAHVTSVTESLNDRLTSSDTNLQSSIEAGALGRRFAQNDGNGGPTFMVNGEDGSTQTFTPPVTVLGTNDPTNLANLANNAGGGTYKLTSGKLFDAGSSDNVAVLGSAIASKNNLKVGSTFTAYNTTITVVGIYDAGNTFANGQVIMPLATVQKLSSQAGDITSAVVNVDSISNIDSVTTAVKSALGSSADVTNSAQQAQAAVAPLENIRTISLYSLIGALIAGSAIILMTMVMIVRERRREIGVIKAIGASNLNVMFQFVTEAVTLTVLAAVIGIGLGVAAGNPITKMLVTNSTTTASAAPGGFGGGPGGGQVVRRFAAGGPGLRGVRSGIDNIHAVVGWSIILYGLAAAILIAIVGSAIAAGFIAKVRPAEVMRSE